MKKILCTMFMLLVFSCSGERIVERIVTQEEPTETEPTSEPQREEPEPMTEPVTDPVTRPINGGAVLMAGLGAFGGDDTSLGKLLSAVSHRLTVLTNTGYMVVISWDGRIIENEILTSYYSGRFCDGVLYTTESHPVYQKSVYYKNDMDGRPLLFKMKRARSRTTYLSTGRRGGTCRQTPLSGNQEHLIELVPTTRQEIGLPETITLPIKIRE